MNKILTGEQILDILKRSPPTSYDLHDVIVSHEALREELIKTLKELADSHRRTIKSGEEYFKAMKELL